jgi:hypothetical protein
MEDSNSKMTEGLLLSSHLAVMREKGIAIKIMSTAIYVALLYSYK